MNTINREHFEAWLFSQPDEQTFNYFQGLPYHDKGCVICNFLREQTNEKNFMVGPYTVEFSRKPTERIQNWLLDVILFSRRSVTDITRLEAKHLKQGYLIQFPNAIVGNTPPEATVSKVESDSIAQESKTILATS